MTRSPAEPENPPPDLAPCSPKDHNRRPAMNLNSDFGARAAVHAARLDWDRCRHRPGVIDTPIWTKLPISAGSDAPVDPKEVARAGLSLGGAGEVQDIANGALFLPSDAEPVIDGGMTGGARPSLELNWGGVRGSLCQRLRSATLAESPIVIYLWKTPLNSHLLASCFELRH